MENTISSSSSVRILAQTSGNIPAGKSSSGPSSASLLVASEVGCASRESANNREQIRRSISLDGVFGRLNESFHRISRALSCTGLIGNDVNRNRHSASHPRRRPWSRVSRRRWHDSSLADKCLLSRTCWPVSIVEALFLPQFPVDYSAESQYEFLEHIANGAFGKVYKVRKVTPTDRQESEDADYALKVLRKAEILDSRALGQVKDEVDIQTLCGHHPFLVRCVRYWQNKKNIFLLLNYYPNGELFKHIKSFSHKLVCLYIAEIALALDFLHQAGVIYRDLKPENVLLDQDYHIRLIDFGLSKWLSVGSRTSTICGTLQYMGKALF